MLTYRPLLSINAFDDPIVDGSECIAFSAAPPLMK
jgi:hypothetical protein